MEIIFVLPRLGEASEENGFLRLRGASGTPLTRQLTEKMDRAGQDVWTQGIRCLPVESPLVPYLTPQAYVEALERVRRGPAEGRGPAMNFENSTVTLFETSWEVCNKVGGIFSVVSSKAFEAVEQFGEDYFLLGPLLAENPGFEETDEHIWDSLKMAFVTRDLKCRLGRWNIPGRPKVVLVDFAKRYSSNQLLYDLWKSYGVDSLSGGWDYIEPVMFATACGAVISAVHETCVEPLGGRSVALFHEWMCGAGLLALKRLSPGVGTVFTTHGGRA